MPYGARLDTRGRRQRDGGHDDGEDWLLSGVVRWEAQARADGRNVSAGVFTRQVTGVQTCVHRV